MPNHCKHKKKKHNSNSRDMLSLLSGLGFALVPKCSFCIFAYSSAITMCSGAKLQEDGLFKNELLYINIGLLIFTLGIILINYKGIKTIFSAIILIAAGSTLLFSNTVSYPFLFYLGSFLLLFSVWVNGSFTWFLKKWRSNNTINLQSTNNN